MSVMAWLVWWLVMRKNEREIRVSKEICKRIITSKDLSDFYAYCERFDDDLTYSFDESEQDRIGALCDYINYTAGNYDEENVKNILGVR